jgi:hypothetical protein
VPQVLCPTRVTGNVHVVDPTGLTIGVRIETRHVENPQPQYHLVSVTRYPADPGSDSGCKPAARNASKTSGAETVVCLSHNAYSFCRNRPSAERENDGSCRRFRSLHRSESVLWRHDGVAGGRLTCRLAS